MTIELSKEALIDEFARDILGSKRNSEDYLKTLARLLTRLRWCHVVCENTKLSRRDARLGPEGVLRGLQKSLYENGYLQKVIGDQGAGYRGRIFVYNPYSHHPEMDGSLLAGECLYETPNPGAEEILEVLYRLAEGESLVVDPWVDEIGVPY